MRAQGRSETRSAAIAPFSEIARFASLAALAVLFASLTACNSITGASDLRLKEVDEEEEDESTGGHVLTGGGNTTATASSGGAAACTYPEGPYGKSVDAVVSPGAKWDGYLEGAAEASELSIEDYLDCDGSKKINALLVLESATWCGACQQEASALMGKLNSSWEAMGIRVLTLMIEDQDSSPATTETALQWRDKFKLEKVAVAADPAISFMTGGSISLPLMVVIDPRTMKIVYTQEGYSGTHGELESLAKQNAGTQ